MLLPRQMSRQVAEPSVAREGLLKSGPRRRIKNHDLVGKGPAGSAPVPSASASVPEQFSWVTTPVVGPGHPACQGRLRKRWIWNSPWSPIGSTPSAWPRSVTGRDGRPPHREPDAAHPCVQALPSRGLDLGGEVRRLADAGLLSARTACSCSAGLGATTPAGSPSPRS
jgi:hypothetical protein